MYNELNQMTLERAGSHIKVAHPPPLFQLPPWQNINGSTILIIGTWVASSH